MVRGEPNQAEASIITVAANTRRKIAFLLGKPTAQQSEAYAIFKEFCKAYLRKPYEFTAEELREELHKVYLSERVRKRADDLIDKLALLEYTETAYSQAEVKLLLQNIDAIIRDLVVEHRQRVPIITRFANWLFRKKPPEQESVMSDYPVVESIDAEGVKINTALEDIYAALDKKKVKQAVRRYKQLIEHYNTLDGRIQIEFYQKITEVYKAIHQHF